MKKSILLVTVLLLSHLAMAQNGQIIYTDFEPDLTQTFHNWVQIGNPVYLDVDQDEHYEWVFKGEDGGWQSIILAFMPADYDTSGLNPNIRFEKYLKLGDTLSSSQYNWNLQYYHWGQLGEHQHLMIGLRYKVDDGYCYGWLDVSIKLYDPAPMVGAATIDLFVHEMAYCTIPNYPFRVGQTDFVWGVDENLIDNLASVYPNPTTGKVIVKGKNLEKAEIYNVVGQKMTSAKFETDKITFNLIDQPVGIYLINVTDKEGRKCIRKVVKE